MATRYTVEQLAKLMTRIEPGADGAGVVVHVLDESTHVRSVENCTRLAALLWFPHDSAFEWLDALGKLIDSIRHDIAADVRLSNCRTFVELHKWCDANTLGTTEADFEKYSMELIEAAQNAVDNWLRAERNLHGNCRRNG